MDASVAPQRSGPVATAEPRAPRPSARRRALVLTLVSLLAWESWEGLRVFHHPWGDLKSFYSDHFSHMNAARVFPRVGLDLWRRGHDQRFRRLGPEELSRLPKDVQAGGSHTGGVFEVPGWDPAKPLVSSWTHIPRNYPPGDLLLVAPVAALYALTPLSLTGANRLLLMLFLLYAHVAFFFALELGLEAEAEPGPRWHAWVRRVTLIVVYLEVVHWTLNGFYDAAALAPLVLCARYLRQRRALAAMAAFCVAAFIHFRTFFFAPWVLYALYLAVRDRAWRSATRREAWAFAGAAALGAISLAVFFVLWPSLTGAPVQNRVYPRHHALWIDAALLPLLLAIAALAARALVRSRAWLDVAVLAWLTLMVVSVHEAYPWHAVLGVLPWLCAPAFVDAPADAARVRVARLAVWLGSAAFAFGLEGIALKKLWPL